MKVLKWIAYISADIGVIMLVLAAISIIARRAIFVENIVNYFHAANTFFLLTILIFLYIHLDQHKKE
jgi:hypothetical protein